MLRIPYIPKAYPDEMLASLLTRLTLHNGPGLWRSLLEECGYGRRSISPFFGPPVQDAKLDRLLAALGYTYPQMLRELTVLPFWLSFNRATNVRFQVNINAAGGPVTELTRLGHTLFLPGARYCPSCLSDDIKAHGEPYVHRHHQLPIAGVCTRHGVALHFACPACGITVMPFNRALLRPPALRCQCGQDLSRITASAPARQQALLRLSQFAADALGCTEAPWNLEQVVAVLYERSDLIRRNFTRGAMQLMQEAFGPPEEIRFSPRTVMSWDFAGLSVPFQIGAGAKSLRAPGFCALLVATGLSFDDFRQAVGKVKVTVKSTERIPHRLFSIEQARQELARFEALSPGRAARRLQKSSRRLYWLLRLSDSELLQASGYSLHRPPPTIEDDRRKIEELLRLNDRASNESGAEIRASIRDQAWLQAKKQPRPSSHANRVTLAQRTQRERAIALSRAVFSALRTQTRPVRLHAGLLAKFVQISMHQAQHTIAHTPALRNFIVSVNAGKDRRLAFWAARGLLGEGRHLTAKEVLLRAGLNTTQVNRQFCIEAISCFTAGHSSR